MKASDKAPLAAQPAVVHRRHSHQQAGRLVKSPSISGGWCHYGEWRRSRRRRRFPVGTRAELRQKHGDRIFSQLFHSASRLPDCQLALGQRVSLSAAPPVASGSKVSLAVFDSV